MQTNNNSIIVNPVGGTVSLDASRKLRYTDLTSQPSFPTPPTLVIHGLEATGKSSVTKSVLESLEVPHVVVDSRECITARHLLEQASISSREVAQRLAAEHASVGALSRCETVNTLENHLEKNLKGLSKFVLVFDGIDRQKEMSPTLIPGLARLGSIVGTISVPVVDRSC
jgi:origin recognition complex subunit 5